MTTNTPATWRMDGSQKPSAGWKMPEAEEFMLYDYIRVKFKTGKPELRQSGCMCETQPKPGHDPIRVVTGVWGTMELVQGTSGKGTRALATLNFIIWMVITWLYICNHLLNYVFILCTNL